MQNITISPKKQDGTPRPDCKHKLGEQGEATEGGDVAERERTPFPGS